MKMTDNECLYEKEQIQLIYFQVNKWERDQCIGNTPTEMLCVQECTVDWKPGSVVEFVGQVSISWNVYKISFPTNPEIFRNKGARHLDASSIMFNCRERARTRRFVWRIWDAVNSNKYCLFLDYRHAEGQSHENGSCGGCISAWLEQFEQYNCLQAFLLV
jgi:hypothetical protein